MERPVDVTKPVTNPELSAAMMRLSQSDCPETQEEVARQLQCATFLVPALMDEMQMAPGGEPGRVTFQEGSVIKMLSCTDAAGAVYLPLFTDWAAIRAWTDGDVATLVMPAVEAWDFVLSQAHYSGAVVNPGEAGLPLSRQQIEYLRHGTQRVRE